MTMYPCRDCRLSEGCEIREEKKRQIRGLGLTSIKFICKKRTESLQPGMKLKAHLPYVTVGYHQGSEGGEPITKPGIMDAVVMKWSRGKVRIYVKPGQEAGELVKGDDTLDVICVRAGLLEATPERVTVCIHCGLPEDAEALRWVCRTAGDNSYWGTGVEALPCEFPKEAVHA